MAIIVALITHCNAVAQYGVSGRVTDKHDSPLIGVNITIKGTYNGTITDTKGRFELSLNDNEATLQVSYIGYRSEEVKINASTKQLSVVLKESTTSLNAVTITAGTFSAGDKKRASVLEALDI